MSRIRKIWTMLGKNIFVGERLEKNMKSIAVLSSVMAVAGLIMFVLNILAGDYIVSLTSVAFLATGCVAYYFTAGRQNRTAGMIISIFAVMSILTYNVLFVSNGFAFLWTMLVPLAVSYLFGVRPGILVSAYFTLLYIVLFYSPLRSLVEMNYPAIILSRFPILYFFHFVVTTFVMIQYHRSVLDQMEYAVQLQRAKEEADQANKAKSAFLAEMSHEIRTPINAVLGMNEMILRESSRGAENPSGEGSREAFRSISTYAGNIENAGNNLLSIINDILDFSKIEAGRIDLVMNDYELRALLYDVSNTISFPAREKGLVYRMDADPKIPNNLYGDKVRVRQIITNLLTNAVKYTERGEVLLQVRSREETYQAGKVVMLQITVRDTGIGIRQEDIPKLFSKFQRVDLDRNSTVEGTGLGLAITHNLLDLMGGSIEVQSVYGEGSAFTVRIPQKVVSCEPIGNLHAGDHPENPSAESRHESFRAPEARILAVDDSRMNLMVVAGLLKKTAIQMDLAQSGREALDLLRKQEYDLILMDQRMPGMDGTETLHALRRMESSPSREAPAVCLTADAIIGAKERYTAQGFTDYLPKPVSGESLENMLLRYLPAEKVIRAKEASDEETPEAEPQAAEGPPAAERYNPLRGAEIRPETGLMYCQQDEGFYDTLLREFASGAPEKAAAMQEYLEKRDWENYGILVHSLKSTARTIGADPLAGKAAALEKAAKAGDEALIRRNHPGMAEMYRRAAEAAGRVAGPAEAPGVPEDGILEFSPEEPS